MRSLLCFILVLAGCNAPSPDFRGTVATRVTVDGSTFDVRRRGLRAEALRVNVQYAPRFGPIRGRAARAMQEVTGCRVVSVSGDQALAVGRLDCGSGPAPPPPAAVELECVPERGTAVRDLDVVRVALDCEPV